MEQTEPGAERHDDQRRAEGPASEDEHEHELVAEGPPTDEPASEEAAAEGGAAEAVAFDVERAPPRSPAHAALDALSKEELIDRHLRLVADLRRIRQRAKEDEEGARREERERVLFSLFDVLDTFERGLERLGGAGEENPWAEGMRAIHRQMLDVLARFGITPYAPFGERFDANEHEALSTIPDPERPDGTIAFVERNGYREPDRVLRPARVVVVRNA